jgi:hypothetical protein
VINAHLSTAVAAPSAETRVLRPAAHLFWAMFAGVALLIALVVGLVIARTPTPAPLAAAGEAIRVRDAVLSEAIAGDPLIQLEPGVTVRSSNLRGLRLNGQVYYYYFEGLQNYDPLSRGKVTPDQVQVVLRDVSAGPPLVIYQVRHS